MQSVSAPVAAATSKDWRWPAGIVALLALHMGAMGIVVFIATRDPSFAVEPQSYKKAVAWDQTRAQQQASNSLGWTVNADISDTFDPLGRRHITCHLTDAYGTAVMAATVKLDAFHHARASERLAATLEPGPAGMYRVDLPMRRAGLWELRIVAQRGIERFDTVISHEIPAVPSHATARTIGTGT